MAINLNDKAAQFYSNALRRLMCAIHGHEYRVLRRMNPGARKIGCDRCGRAWGMHDATRAVVPWDEDLEALYAPGGVLGPRKD